MGAPSQETYREVIIRHAIEPCLIAKIRQQGLDKQLGMDQSLKLMKIMTRDNTEKAVTALTPIVTGKDLTTRMTLYRVSAEICAKSQK